MSELYKALALTVAKGSTEITHYFSIQETEEGYDYTLYDALYNEIDGGIYENLNVSLNEAIEEILSEFDLEKKNRIPEDYDSIEEHAYEKWNENIAYAKSMMLC